MNINVTNLADSYYAWLKDKTVWKQLDGAVEITTPHLDRHNDYIQLYLKQDGDGYILTDEGYTIQDLEMSGCSLDSPKRQSLLAVTLNGFGVKKNGGELFVKATQENFAVSKHNLIQAILAVNDMFYLARSTVANVFFEDVRLWLESSEIRFIERVPFTGLSGYIRHFDFVIPKSRDKPERIIQTMNHPTKEKAELLAFGWLDTKEDRPEGAKPYLIVNDAEKKVPPSFEIALDNYGITTIAWNEREEYTRQLAA